MSSNELLFNEAAMYCSAETFNTHPLINLPQTFENAKSALVLSCMAFYTHRLHMIFQYMQGQFLKLSSHSIHLWYLFHTIFFLCLFLFYPSPVASTINFVSNLEQLVLLSAGGYFIHQQQLPNSKVFF